jgi:segregation and condensation protein A
MLELIQQKYFFIIMGEGINNFIVEYNNERLEDVEVEQQVIVNPIEN